MGFKSSTTTTTAQQQQQQQQTPARAGPPSTSAVSTSTTARPRPIRRYGQAIRYKYYIELLSERCVGYLKLRKFQK